MAAAPVTHDERKFASEITAVVEKYQQVEQQIQRFKDIDVSQKLEAFLGHFHGKDEASVIISNLVQEAANHYRRVEDEAREHVLRAKDFAQENIDAVEGVNNNKYFPEEALENFQDMGKQLKQSSDRLVEAHQEVIDYLKEAERKAKVEKEAWGKSERAADTVVQATIPILGVGHASRMLADKAAASVDSKAGKAVLRIVGGAAGMLGGIISSLLLVPVITSAILQARYKSWMQEFCDIQDSLGEVDKIISEHKSTLHDICHNVDSLCNKYEVLKSKLAGGRSLKLTLDQIVIISEKLKKACEVYLSRIETTEGITIPDGIARRLPALEPNPALPVQCSGKETMAKTDPCKENDDDIV